MQVQYKIVGASNKWTTLFDNSNTGLNPEFRPSFKDSVQVTQGFGAPSQAITPNGNTIVSFSLPVVLIYASYQDALAAVRLWRSALKGQKIHLAVTEGIEVQYYPNGSLEGMDANVKGCCVEYTFHFQTQDVTTTKPT